MALPWPTLGWIDAASATLPYLSIALPFALVTIIGGIDNTESAAAAGDEYPTPAVPLPGGGGRRISNPRRSPDRGGGDHPGRRLRRGRPEHAVYRPPGVQSDGRGR